MTTNHFEPQPTLYDQDADPSTRPYNWEDEPEEGTPIATVLSFPARPTEVAEKTPDVAKVADINHILDKRRAEAHNPLEDRRLQVALGLAGLAVSYFITDGFKTPVENIQYIAQHLGL